MFFFLSENMVADVRKKKKAGLTAKAIFFHYILLCLGSVIEEKAGMIL